MALITLELETYANIKLCSLYGFQCFLKLSSENGGDLTGFFLTGWAMKLIS